MGNNNQYLLTYPITKTNNKQRLLKDIFEAAKIVTLIDSLRCVKCPHFSPGDIVCDGKSTSEVAYVKEIPASSHMPGIDPAAFGPSQLMNVMDGWMRRKSMEDPLFRRLQSRVPPVTPPNEKISEEDARMLVAQKIMLVGLLRNKKDGDILPLNTDLTAVTLVVYPSKRTYHIRGATGSSRLINLLLRALKELGWKEG
jgi:hypothetical protein